MSGTSKEVKLSLKLMIDTKSKKVIFAEAEKEFVDFILSLMSLPLSCVTRILLHHKMEMVGSLGDLYKSIQSLDRYCFEGGGTDQVVQISSRRGAAGVSIPRLLSFHNFVMSSPEPRYVKRGSVYMVTDNLEVKLLSIALIKAHVTDFNELEEKHVEVGLQEGLAILKAYLETNAVLTKAFLP